MELSIAARMGGPELAESIHPTVIALRRALKSEFSSMDMADGLTISITLFFDGSISSYECKVPTPGARYSKRKKEVLAETFFDREEVKKSSQIELLRLVQGRLGECFEQVSDVLKKHGVAADRDGWISALDRAFARLLTQ
jgi:Immunity protein 12